MKEKNIFNQLHRQTKRNYQERATASKPEYAALAKQFDFDYWDGKRETGYGGYRDDGRWQKIADLFIETYQLNNQSSVLDVGCGKAYLLKELKQKLPGIKIAGVDISRYALERAPELVRCDLTLSSCTRLPFADQSFDLVLSINVLHNLGLMDLMTALKEIQRVSRRHSYLCVESYRTEEEKWNLMRWQLTCEAFYRPEDWRALFDLTHYGGDYEFIFFT